ncbi:MAG: TonB-dependent receptor [Sphingobacteriales bacterium]|nr:MAG: TonB-dependent receptor [Sphingobacteriales bacterium]
MFRFLFLLFILEAFFQQIIYAQNPGEAKVGRIAGKLTDATTQKPVEFASVMVLRPQDSSLVSGALTKEDGQFVIEKIAFGNYIIKIQSIGYETFKKAEINLTAEKPFYILKDVKIVSTATSTEEVIIEGEKRLIQTSIDKKIFNVSQTLVTTGGTAKDVLEQVPSVSVDNEGNISLRGSNNVTIFIDGKPSTLSGSLDNIPSNAIERVELMTNPSAKYDPQGMAGIINIVLKKERKPGYNGNISLNIGSRNKANSSASINYNYGKINLSGMYSFRYSENYSFGSSFRKQYLDDKTFFLNQENDGNTISNTHMAKLGLDYNINSKNSLGFSFTYNYNLRRQDEDLQYKEWIEPGTGFDAYARENFLNDWGNAWDGSLNYTHKFKKEGSEISFNGSVNKSYDVEDRASEWLNTSPRLDYNSRYEQQRTINSNNSIISILQADYVTPSKKENRFESGYKTTFRQFDNDFDGKQYDTIGLIWVDKSRLSNRFIYKEQVHAGYVNYAGKYKKWGYQTGLRAEQTFINTLQVVDDTANNNSYFNLFPSAYLSRKLTESQEMQLSYTRRINRPGLGTLNPFPDYADPLNLRTGNPNLKPENIDAYELGYVMHGKKMTFSSTAYARRTFNQITRLRRIDTQGISITTFSNINNSSSYGLELISTNNWKPWLSTVASANIYRTELTGTVGQKELSRGNFSYIAKISSNIKLPKKTELQLSYNYRGPQIFPQGTMKPMHGLDAAFKAQVLKGKGTLSVTASDVLNTRKFAVTSIDENFEQEFIRKWETRVVFVGFSYRFGNAKPIMQNRKRNAGDENSGGGGDMGF